MSDAIEFKAKRLKERVELSYAQKEASRMAFDEEKRHTAEPVYSTLRDATSRRYGKPSIAETVAIKRGLKQPITE